MTCKTSRSGGTCIRDPTKGGGDHRTRHRLGLLCRFDLHPKGGGDHRTRHRPGLLCQFVLRPKGGGSLLRSSHQMRILRKQPRGRGILKGDGHHRPLPH